LKEIRDVVRNVQNEKKEYNFYLHLFFGIIFCYICTIYYQIFNLPIFIHWKLQIIALSSLIEYDSIEYGALKGLCISLEE